MTKKTAPCRDCGKRYPSCHTKCPLYIAFAAENARENAAHLKMAKYRDDVESFRYDSLEKYRRRVRGGTK